MRKLPLRKNRRSQKTSPVLRRHRRSPTIRSLFFHRTMTRLNLKGNRRRNLTALLIGSIAELVRKSGSVRRPRKLFRNALRNWKISKRKSTA